MGTAWGQLPPDPKSLLQLLLQVSAFVLFLTPNNPAHTPSIPSSSVTLLSPNTKLEVFSLLIPTM